MKVNKIVRYLVKDYGWSNTDKFTDIQLELIKDVADIVSNRLEKLGYKEPVSQPGAVADVNKILLDGRKGVNEKINI